MAQSDNYQTRNLKSDESARIKKDLTIRGWLALISATMIVSFAIFMTIHSLPIFSGRGLSFPCIGAIWIAAIAMGFGFVRSGFQYLSWKDGSHTGVVRSEKTPFQDPTEQILNIISAIVFCGLGIAILIAGRFGSISRYAIPQIPLSFLSISIGLSSAESAYIYFWLRKRNLVDVIHEKKTTETTKSGK